MKKGNSYIFLDPNYNFTKHYNAPFDIILNKKFSNSHILDIDVIKDDRIIQIKVSKNSKYKLDTTILQLEFTGKNTNAIIISEDKTILEALRHININTSFRTVKVGGKLIDLEPKKFKPRDEYIDDIEKFLKDEHLKKERLKLDNIRTKRLLLIDNKIDRLKNILNSIKDEKIIKKDIDDSYNKAQIITANLYRLKDYQKEFELKDFNGKTVHIKLDSETITPKIAAKTLFKKVKKLKQVVQNNYIERQNLLSKIDFYNNLKHSIQNAKSGDEIELYFPKTSKSKKKNKNSVNIADFFLLDYKLSIGKNQKGNQTLLENAKMSDIWMHIKDHSSSHVIIKNRKKNVPFDVLEFGAKLCVNFSKLNFGKYLVDYTYRRNIKVREGAYVNYTDYKTIEITKE
jgi:predicted ribosome quality control (RQC) complex YloA/Tae2 family protein